MDGQTVAFILITLTIVTIVGTYAIGEVFYNKDGQRDRCPSRS